MGPEIDGNIPLPLPNRPPKPQTCRSPSTHRPRVVQMIRKALKLGLLLVVLVVAFGYYAVDRLRTGPEIRSETLTLDGLREPVEVLYDSMGVPHIFASSLDDLFFAQGHVHATHRLWQMEVSRRVLQGRLSEIYGPATLDSDRFLRTIGLEEAAVAGTPSPDAPIYHQMERYAEGVNAAIDSWGGVLPPEFVLLRFRPEPWNPVLTQGIEKIMAWDLSDYQTGLNLAAAREVLGDSALAPLMPSYPEWGVTIVDGWPEAQAGAAESLPPPFPPQHHRSYWRRPPCPTTWLGSWSWGVWSGPPTPGWWVGSGPGQESPLWPMTCTWP